MTKPIISEDGHWMWNGTNWVAVTTPEQVVSKEDIESDLVESAAEKSGIEAEQIAEVARYFDLNQDGEVDAAEIEQATSSLTNPVDVPSPGSSEEPVPTMDESPKPKEMFDEHMISASSPPPQITQQQPIPIQETPRVVQQQPIPIQETPRVVHQQLIPVQQQPRIVTTRIGHSPSIIISYVLWFFLGWAGIHHLYIGRGVGVWILSLITFQGLGVWWLIDLFLIPSSCSKRGTQTVVVR